MKPLTHFAEWNERLLALLDLSREDQETALAELRSSDPESARRLAAMLVAAYAEEDSGDPMAALREVELWASLADDPATGQQFGHWRVVGTIAHGGMARILLAERDDGGFQQRAAIKTLWSGLASPQLVARFEQERQILARLNDPRIAHLLDGGVRQDGVPWLALEYVVGKTISSHCDDLRLDIKARLALWQEVAAAVSCAHRQLVVHRDLKPSNILVSTDGAVKLLDFGIAKLLDTRDFPHAAPATRLDETAWTRAYASPEQLQGDPITTASDVYQLGLLLLELVAGVTGNRDARVIQASSLVRKGPDADHRAQLRCSTPKQLARTLRGDLDAIVLRALADSPEDRYPSVEAVSEDLRRWQTGLPVRARRLGSMQRTARWVRRHALATGATASIMILLAVYAVTTTLQSREIARQATMNRGVRDFLVAWVQAADPGASQGRELSSSEMLAGGLDVARDTLSAQPDLLAEMLGIVGEVHVARGDYIRAEPLLREAYAIRRGLPSPDPNYRGASAAALGMLLHYQGHYAEAGQLFRAALEQRLRAIGAHQYPTLITRQQFADLLHTRGLYAEASSQLREILAAVPHTPDVPEAFALDTSRMLADVHRDSGRLEEAEALYLDALDDQLQLHGEMHPNTAATRLSFGLLLLQQGRSDEAARQIEPAFERFVRLRGRDTPATAYWERVVAQLEESRGNIDASAVRLQAIRSRMQSRLPANHLMFGYLALDAGFVELARGAPGEARRNFAEAERIFDAIQPKGHPRRVAIRLGMSLAARQSGDSEDAAAMLEQSVSDARRFLDPGHPLVAAIALAQSGVNAKTVPPRELASVRVFRAVSQCVEASCGN